MAPKKAMPPPGSPPHHKRRLKANIIYEPSASPNTTTDEPPPPNMPHSPKAISPHIGDTTTTASQTRSQEPSPPSRTRRQRRRRRSSKGGQGFHPKTSHATGRVAPSGAPNGENDITKAFARSSPNLLHEESDLPHGSQPMDEMTKVHHRRGDPARCSSTTTVPQNIAQAILAPPPWRSRNQQAPSRHAERPLFGFGN